LITLTFEKNKHCETDKLKVYENGNLLILRKVCPIVAKNKKVYMRDYEEYDQEEARRGNGNSGNNFFGKKLAGDNSPGLTPTQKRSDSDLSPRTPTVAKGTSKLGTRLASSEPQDLNKKYGTNSPGMPPRIEMNSYGSVYQNSTEQ
jgi:hypothetical protein